MKRPRATILTFTLLLIASMVWTTSCSNNSNNVTNPPPTGNLELNSGNIPNGGTFPHTFANAGTYNYRCTIHAGMAGSVTVAGGQPATAAVTITDNTFTPANAMVAPGGTVTWTNNGTTHTVTSN